VNLLKRLLSRRQPLSPEQRASDLIKAIDAGGIPLNPAVVNDIARKLGLDVLITAPMDETIARIRIAIGVKVTAKAVSAVADAVIPGGN
jgi:hypothetical protein